MDYIYKIKSLIILDGCGNALTVDSSRLKQLSDLLKENEQEIIQCAVEARRNGKDTFFTNISEYFGDVSSEQMQVEGWKLFDDLMEHFHREIHIGFNRLPPLVRTQT